MASQLDAATDAVQAPSDNTSASHSLINEVNNDRATAKPADAKPADQGWENKVTAAFGSLTIFGDDSKDSTAAVKATTDTASASTDSTTAAAGDATKATADTKATTTDATAVAATGDTKPAATDATAAAATGTDTTTANSTDNHIARSGGDGAAPQGPEDVAKASDKPVDAAAEQKIQDDPQVKAEQKKLNDDITKQEKGMDTNSPEFKHLEDMRNNMDMFKERAATENPPLGPEEVAKTFKSVSHMMEAKDAKLSQTDRTDLAQQVMLHAADPRTIDQGTYNTCNVSTVENRMFSKNPSAAASMIDQVATKGEYTIPGGKPGDPASTVKVNADEIMRRKDGLDESSSIPHDRERSYASEIFQVTAVNAYYKTHDLQIKDGSGNVTATYPKGTVEYRQGLPNESSVPPNPTGEGLYDTSKNPPALIMDGKNAVMEPHMTAENTADTYSLLTDHKDSGFTFVNKDYGPAAGSDLTQFGSKEELQTKLQEAQKDGKMPVILYVHTGQEPFFSDNKGNQAGGEGGGHVVTITGFDDKGNPVVENQWGKGSKHSVPIGELYTATLTPKDAVTDLKAECAQNAKDGHVDYAKEAELLRMRHDQGEIPNDKQYKDQLTMLTREAIADAAANKGGKLDHETEVELQRQLNNEFGRGTDKDFQKLKDAIGADETYAIVNRGDGNIGIDTQNFQKDHSADYGTKDAADAAKAVFDAGDQTLYFSKADYKKLDDALANKSPAEIRQMDEQFKHAHNGQSMEDYIKDRFKRHPEERDHALDLLHKAQNGGDKQAA